MDDATVLATRAGDALTFDTLTVGQRLGVQAELRADGQWWATEIKAGRQAGVAP